MSRTESSRDRRFRNVSSWLAALLGALGAAGCAHSRFEPIDLEALPSAARYPGAEGVILFEEQRVELREEEGEPVAVVKERGRQRIFKDGGRWLGALHASYRKDLYEVTSFSARVTTPSGEVRDLGRDKASDLPSRPGFVLYSESRALSLDLTEVPLGSVIEYEFVTRFRKPHLWLYEWDFESYVPVERSRFEVHVPPGFDIEHLGLRFEEPVELPPKVSKQGDVTVYTWEKRALPAIQRERYASREHPVGDVVAVRLKRWTVGGAEEEGFSDVVALSRWKYEMTRDKTVVTPEIEALAAEIVGGAQEPYEKAKRLYAWTLENVSYCAIYLGMDGWIPHPSSQTENLRYGDCKDKANLLRSLLKAQGIESYLATLYAHQGMPRRFRLPVLAGNSNHMILVVDIGGERVVCDPTTRTTPFGRLPYADQGADLLMATPEGASLFTTELSSPDDNGYTVELALTLKPGARTKGTFHLVTRGERADETRYALLATTAQGYGDVIADALPTRGARVSKVKVENDGAPLEPVPLEAEGRIKLLSIAADIDRVVWRPGDLLFDSVPALPMGERRAPVVLGVPERRLDQVRIELPEGSSAELPPPFERESRYGRYALRYAFTGNVLEVRREYERRAPVVPAAEYGALRAFFDEILEAEAKPALLRLPTEEK